MTSKLWTEVLKAEAAITAAQDVYKSAPPCQKEAATVALRAAMDSHAILARRLCVPADDISDLL